MSVEPCRVPLLHGGHALVDAADFPVVSQRRWRLSPQGYVLSGRGFSCSLHRFLFGLDAIAPGLEVDHINGDKQDNRRSNLRLVTRQENCLNQPPYKGRKYKGVYFHAKTGKWRAMLNRGRVRHYFGLFETEEDAARAYNEGAKRLCGEFARLNIIVPEKETFHV